MKAVSTVRLGTAGWSVSRDVTAAFAEQGSNLRRYASVFDAVEINSSFHRPHRISTYRRWAAAVPETFRFSVKLPKAVTHTGKLSEVGLLVDGFLAQLVGLGSKLGPLLVQLPPRLTFDPGLTKRFLCHLRDRVAGPIACEPRHASWFTPEAERLFVEFRIGRVAADPAPVPEAGHPGGWKGLTYYRLHGSPRVYFSAYSDQTIRALVSALAVRAGEGSECWCIFDNTASGAAVANAMAAGSLLTAPLYP